MVPNIKRNKTLLWQKAKEIDGVDEFTSKEKLTK
jgi:hypothetical protein